MRADFVMNGKLLIFLLAICWNARADVLVGDWNNHKVFRFSDSGASLGMFGDASDAVQLGIPGGIAIGNARNVYVKSITYGNIYRFNQNGSYLGVYGDPGTGTQRGLAFDRTGSLWLRRFGGGNGNSGSLMVRFNGSGIANFEFNTGVPGYGAFAFDPQNSLYLPRDYYLSTTLPADPADGVYRFLTDGTPLGPFGQATQAATGCGHPESVAFDSHGRLYVMSRERILRYDETGTFLGVFASGNLAGYLMIDPSDNVYVGHGNGDGVVKYASNGAMLGKIIRAGVGGLPANFRNEGIAYLPPPVPEPFCSVFLIALMCFRTRRESVRD